MWRFGKSKMPDKQEKTIRVVWGSEEHTEIVYANQIIVSFAGGTEFNIIFGQLSPPLTVGLNESELPDRLEIKPVAHIVASPDVMRAFVRVLVDNLENFEKRLQNKEFEDDDNTVR
jgi:hypothetical protein